jgi:hypothetical protein
MLPDELERVLRRVLVLTAGWAYMFVAFVVFVACLVSVNIAPPADGWTYALAVAFSAALAMAWPVTLGLWLGNALLP